MYLELKIDEAKMICSALISRAGHLRKKSADHYMSMDLAKELEMIAARIESQCTRHRVRQTFPGI